MFRNSFGKSHAGGQGEAARQRQGDFWGYHRAILLTVAYSAIFVTTGQEQHGESDEDPDGDAKYGFGQLVDLPAEPVAVAKHGRPVVAMKKPRSDHGARATEKNAVRQRR